MDHNDIPAGALNTAFVDKIMNDGLIKEAESSTTSYIRKEMKEGSFLADKIMTEQFITRDQLDKDENLDNIKKIVEIEPESTATWISFKGTPPSRYLKQGTGVAYFGEITTEKVIKNIMELKTRDNDVRKIIGDNQVKDVLEQQDGRFIESARSAVVTTGQFHNFPGGFTKINVAEALKLLVNLKLPNGCMLINEATSKEFLKWDTSDIGYEPVTKHYANGLTEGKIMGTKLITTIKNDIVLDNEMFLFTTEDHLGKFFTLEDSRVFMKTEGPWLEWYTYKCLAILIANINGVYRVTYGA